MKKGQKTAKPGKAATVTVLNTRTHEVDVVYRSDKGADEFFATSDGQRVFLLSSGTRIGSTGSAVAAGLTMGILMGKALPKDVAQELAIFGGTSPQPLKQHLLSSHVTNIVLSRDQTQMIMVGQRVESNAKGQGVLQVLDVRTAQITEPNSIGREPRRLFRLENREGIWLAGREEMRLISERGELSDKPIVLSWDASHAGDGAGKPSEVEGYPGKTLELDGGKAVIQILKKNGADKKQLALVDLNAQKMLSVIPVGNKGVRTRRKVGAIALAVGLSMGAGMAAYGAASPYSLVFYPNTTSRLGSVVKRPDGQFFYALDPESDDLTVIRADGQITAHVPFASSSSLWAPRGSRYILGLGGKDIEVLDSESQTFLGKTKVGSGGIVITAIDDTTNELYIMGNKGLEVWDGASGKPARLYTDFEYRSVVQIVLPDALRP